MDGIADVGVRKGSIDGTREETDGNHVKYAKLVEGLRSDGGGPAQEEGVSRATKVGFQGPKSVGGTHDQPDHGQLPTPGGKVCP